MARGESAGLQIALIIFVVLTLILGVTTVLFFNQYTEFEDKFLAAQEESRKNQAAYSDIASEAEDLKVIIGQPPNAPMTDVRAAFTSDMTTYSAMLTEGGQLTEAEWNYHNMLDRLSTSIAAAEKNRLEKEQQYEQVSAQLASVEQANSQSKQQLNNDLAKVQGELQNEVTKYNTQVQQMTQQYEQQFASLNQTIQQLQNEKNNLVKEAQTKDRLLATANAQVAQLARDLEIFRNQTPTPPDGEITWIDRRSGTVLIDLGSADGLPEQLTFSVYPKETLQVDGETVAKGKIQVKRIVRDHQAEATITNGSVTNPILSGDRIHTPLWKPGDAQRFAIAGFLDIQGDGQPDNEAIKRIIRQAGAALDAEVTAKGAIEGAITNETDYLVKGAVRGGGPGAQAAIAKSTSDMESEAARNGVRVISLDDFLDMTGFNRNSQVYLPGAGNTFNLDTGN